MRETKEKDRQPLGGSRPNAGPQQHNVPLVTGVSGGFGGTDEADTGPSTRGTGEGGRRESDDDDDELDASNGGEGYVGDGDVASDQVRHNIAAAAGHDPWWKEDNAWSEDANYD